jgi:hypothetical protein
MKMAAIAEAFGIGIGVVIAIGSRLFRITIANPDIDTDSECYSLSLFSEQALLFVHRFVHYSLRTSLLRLEARAFLSKILLLQSF